MRRWHRSAMELVVIAVAALFAALLSFFTGFGLGTLLLPVFALFMPVPEAIALTAVVHVANGFLKLGLTARHVVWRVVMVFGAPAVVGAIAGAWILLSVSNAEPLLTYSLAGRSFAMTPVKLLVGVLLAAFALAEAMPALKRVTFAPRWLAVGGILSGFFGGLAGMQGALRSAFLVRAGLTKESFVATGAALASLIDLSRLGIYSQALQEATLSRPALGVALIAASAGAIAGSLLLSKVPLAFVERLVAGLLLAAALALMAGLI